MWPLIVEKAYAVFKSDDPKRPSYYSIDGGYAYDDLTALTGREGHRLPVQGGTGIAKEFHTGQMVTARLPPQTVKDLDEEIKKGTPIIIDTHSKRHVDAYPDDPLYSLDAQNPTPGPYPFVGSRPVKEPLISGHSYWVTKVDTAAKTVTLQSPWGSGKYYSITITEEQFQHSTAQISYDHLKNNPDN